MNAKVVIVVPSLYAGLFLLNTLFGSLVKICLRKMLPMWRFAAQHHGHGVVDSNYCISSNVLIVVDCCRSRCGLV